MKSEMPWTLRCMLHEIFSALSYVRLYVPTHRTLAETHLFPRWATESLRNCIFSTAGRSREEKRRDPFPPVPSFLYYPIAKGSGCRVARSFTHSPLCARATLAFFPPREALPRGTPVHSGDIGQDSAVTSADQARKKIQT
ncbi:hypothetical protein HNY73_015479 [Argiope bruennichi]|uniref:Uncharacterized protein n=1 Tax=Argiope bruennichi TaxID=94029 RepID=A0A8T0ESR4_ARGBR|nr:hypothetical protein HNY73_015479 [Argiope bruennichi]